MSEIDLRWDLTKWISENLKIDCVGLSLRELCKIVVRSQNNV